MTQGLERVLARFIDNLDEGNRTKISVEDDPFLYKYYFTVDISNLSDILCPLFCINHIRRVIDNDILQEEHTSNIVIPMQFDTSDRTFKTIDSALKYMFESGNALSLVKIDFKNEVFYGNKNLILADNFIPIFMVCARYDAITRQFKEIVVVVEETLLINLDSTVEKAIMKKLLPYYIERNMYYNYDRIISCPFEGQPSVLFTHIKNMVTTNRTLGEPYVLLENNLQTLIDSIDYVA